MVCRLPLVPSCRTQPPGGHRQMAGALWTLLRGPAFDAATATRAVPRSRAFYDGQHGLRVIVVSPTLWGEAWMCSRTARRASMHTSFMQRAVVLEYDAGEAGVLHVVKDQDWPDEWLAELGQVTGTPLACRLTVTARP